MRATLFVPVFAAAVLGQSSSGDDFPQTSFLQQTNSLGVVTGQPAPASSIPAQPPAVSSQPAVNTNVGAPASIPAVSPGIQTVPVQGTAGPNSTQTIVVSANNSTTVILSTIGAGGATGSGASGSGASANPTGTSARASGSGAGASNSASASSSQSTGAAATMRAVAGSVVGVGAFVAAFL